VHTGKRIPVEKQVYCLGLRINYIDEGQGDVIIFLHNGGGFWQCWTHQIDYFSSTHRVIALDFPWFGKSDTAPELPTLDFNYRVLRAFCAQLGLTDLVLAGNCIGASVALRYHYEHPGEVRRLVLMNICPGKRLIRSGIMRYLLFRVHWAPFRTTFQHLLQWVALHTPVKRLFPAILFGGPVSPKDYLYNLYVEKFKENKQTEARTMLLFALESYTLQSFYRREVDLSQCLLLWGANNKAVSLKKEGFYHQRLCGIRDMQVIPQVGHLAMYEAPETVNNLLQSHISAIL
jgi:pimeloyl-ACP methyl ester carboxylesterase